jgi:hypothetical protein
MKLHTLAKLYYNEKSHSCHRRSPSESQPVYLNVIRWRQKLDDEHRKMDSYYIAISKLPIQYELYLNQSIATRSIK